MSDAAQKAKELLERQKQDTKEMALATLQSIKASDSMAVLFEVMSLAEVKPHLDSFKLADLVDGFTATTTKRKSGSRTRMTQEQKDALEAKIVSFLAKQSEPVPATAVTESLDNYPDSNVRNTLSGLVKAKKVKKTGERRNSRYSVSAARE